MLTLLPLQVYKNPTYVPSRCSLLLYSGSWGPICVAYRDAVQTRAWLGVLRWVSGLSPGQLYITHLIPASRQCAPGSWIHTGCTRTTSPNARRVGCQQHNTNAPEQGLLPVRILLQAHDNERFPDLDCSASWSLLYDPRI